MTSIGCSGGSKEDRHHARQLDVYLAQQDAAEQRERAIKEEAKELMRPGQECDPYLVAERSYGQASGVFKSFHFAEAIAEMPDEQMAQISELFANAERTQLNVDFAKAAMVLSYRVKTYWEGQATAVAERGMK